MTVRLLVMRLEAPTGQAPTLPGPTPALAELSPAVAGCRCCAGFARGGGYLLLGLEACRWRPGLGLLTPLSLLPLPQDVVMPDA